MSFPEVRPLSGNGPSWYFLAKNHGLIKIYHEGHLLIDQTKYNESWDLIRKKIIQ